MHHVLSLRMRRQSLRGGRAGETCEVLAEHLIPSRAVADHHWWRFVVRPASLVSPAFLADCDPTALALRHPCRSHPAAQVAFASILTDCMRAGWVPEPRGTYWFNARFRRPPPLTPALGLTRA